MPPDGTLLHGISAACRAGVGLRRLLARTLLARGFFRGGLLGRTLLGRCSLCRLFFCRFGPAVLEVGRVPPGSFQLETRSANQLLQCILATLGAFGVQRIIHTL